VDAEGVEAEAWLEEGVVGGGRGWRRAWLEEGMVGGGHGWRRAWLMEGWLMEGLSRRELSGVIERSI